MCWFCKILLLVSISVTVSGGNGPGTCKNFSKAKKKRDIIPVQTFSTCNLPHLLPKTWKVKVNG